MASDPTANANQPSRFISIDSKNPLPELHSGWATRFSLEDRESIKKMTQQDTGESIRLSIETAEGKIWLEGNSLFVNCPDCQAPVSVPLWLLTADCWQCEARIVVPPEQAEAIAHRLKNNSTTEREPVKPLAEPILNKTENPKAKLSIAPRLNRRKRRAAGEMTSVERLRRMRDKRSAVARMRDAFRMTPAWLISFLLHLVLIIILLMLYLENRFGQKENGITLSTAISVEDAEGAEIKVEAPERQLDFEAPLPRDADLSNLEVRKSLVRADQDAKELRIDDAPLAPLPDIKDVRRSITQRQGQSSRFIARDPRMRVEILKKEGGTSLSEAAVARGLRWLSKVQNLDGSWSLTAYKYHYKKNNRGDMAATALALLPFLGAGQTHEYGKYKQTVAKGLRWIIDNQDPASGDLRKNVSGNSAMYAHGQAAIVLVEAYALTGDEQFRKPAQLAIDFIVGAQHVSDNRQARGGWRYRPGEAGDTSVLGWQMMALQSALSPNLGLDVPRKTLLLAQDYLDSAGNAKKKGMPSATIYSYQPRKNNPTPAMTAEALLCRIYLGWNRDDVRLKIGTDYLLETAPPSKRESGRYNLYYIYYATQLFHHYGGSEWRKWNDQMQSTLIGLQETEGTYAGSWPEKHFRWGEAGKRIYSTALAVCTLEVYYRHLP
ncbi:MAG: prenyltransferase/squalene oxidase repeat-containing protein, partial [Planctomycetota bacterium]|nr:prenyltransferase/squalene oxidase repeat-containing protein [Planctomycetota bacterium]